MAYFTINGNDFSMYVSGLKILRAANYSAQTNAAGDTVVDYINHKRTIEVTIIPLNSEVMETLQALISELAVDISYRNPQTGEPSGNIHCIIPEQEVEYFTIQADRVLFNALTLKFIEL